VTGGPAGVTQPMTLRIFTVQGSDGKTRLDLLKTAFAADPTLKQAMDKAQMTTCASNLKQISLGIIMYAQDHNETLPDAAKWVDEVMPYVKNEALFHDPQDAPDHPWSYAFNKALSGKKLAAIANPAETVLLFDSTLGTKNASDSGESLPHPGRHSGGNVYAFADGHVKFAQDGSAPAISG
jgi:prepilin-type processing-associated H-X9-DG protein